MIRRLWARWWQPRFKTGEVFSFMSTYVNPEPPAAQDVIVRLKRRSKASRILRAPMTCWRYSQAGLSWRWACLLTLQMIRYNGTDGQ